MRSWRCERARAHFLASKIKQQCLEEFISCSNKHFTISPRQEYNIASCSSHIVPNDENNFAGGEGAMNDPSSTIKNSWHGKRFVDALYGDSVRFTDWTVELWTLRDFPLGMFSIHRLWLVYVFHSRFSSSVHCTACYQTALHRSMQSDTAMEFH